MFVEIGSNFTRSNRFTMNRLKSPFSVGLGSINRISNSVSKLGLKPRLYIQVGLVVTRYAVVFVSK